MSATSIANSMYLPGRFAQPRLSDGYAVKKTAVANPFVEVPNTYQIVGSAAFSAGYFFRDPLRNYVIPIPNNVAPQNSRYDYVFLSPSLASSTAIASGQTLQIVPQYLALHTGVVFAPHGNYLYAGQADGRVGVWFDSNTQLVAQFDLLTVNNDLSVQVYIWDGRKWQQYHTALLAGVAANTDITLFTANDCGYFSVDITSNRSPADVITLTEASIQNYVASELIFGHHPLPGIDDNFDDTKAIRIPAFGITLRNSTAVEFLNGQATACMMSKGDDPVKYFNDGFPLDMLYTQVAALKDSQVISFKNSLYTYLRPNEISDLRYVTAGAKDVQYGDAFPTDAYGYFSLRPEAGWLLLVVQVVAQTVSVAGTSSQFRLEYGLQYDTTNTWLATRAPAVSETAVDDACKILARLPLVLDGESSEVSAL